MAKKTEAERRGWKTNPAKQPKSKITGWSYPHRIIASLFGTKGQKKGNFRVNHEDGRFFIIRGGARYYIDRPFGSARLSWRSADDD
jgi:hypothetical protein